MALAAAVAAACAATPSPAARAPAPETPDPRAVELELERVVGSALDWVAASDPRLAMREGSTASEETLERIGTEAVLAEDGRARIRGASLDLFAFQARGRALGHAAAQLAAFGDRAPERAPADSAIARPRLEWELLVRLIDEEESRAKEEADFAEASADLVRGIVSTWTPPEVPQEWLDRDEWVSVHLRDIRDSLRVHPADGPLDLDVALYPLERLLAPMQFPRGSAAIAELRVGLDSDTRPVPPLVAPERIARGAKVHLGVALDPSTLLARLESTEARLRDLAGRALEASADARPAIEARARRLLLTEGPCPAVTATRVRSMSPPPERAAICGAVRALAEEAGPGAALVALHDDVLLAFSAIATAPPARTGLLSHPEDDVVDALRRAARERPLPVIGVALAAELLYAGDGAEDRIRAWSALGEAPLDVVARELLRAGAAPR